MKTFVTFIVGIVFGALLSFAFMRRNNIVIYDPTILAHVNEAILNAEQIRRGESEEVLSRTDAWLQGDQIDRSMDGYMVDPDLKKKATTAINNYRLKYEPYEASATILPATE